MAKLELLVAGGKDASNALCFDLKLQLFTHVRNLFSFQRQNSLTLIFRTPMCSTDILAV